MKHSSRFSLLLILALLVLALGVQGVIPTSAATTIAVQSAADDGTTVAGNCPGAGCRLRDAIAAAASGDTITFDSDHTITLAATLTIDKDLTIDGSGHRIIISGDKNGSGGANAGDVGVFLVNNSVTATLKALTITKGYDTNGAGINNNGTLNLINSTLSANIASNAGGAIYNNGSTLNMTNSTITGNTSLSYAGGIYNGGGTFHITNSTIAKNSVTGSVIEGVGIYNNTGSTLVMNNTIIADSTGGNDCHNRETVSGTHNLVENNGTGGYSCGVLNTNYIAGDPNLGSLTDNGGDTPTLALLFGSPAIDAGDSATCAAAPVNGKDQRGVIRPSACDIGAFEYFLAAPGAFHKSSPTNAATLQPVNLTLQWSASDTATSYELCWRESYPCDDMSPFEPMGNVTSWDLHGLTGGTTYYWNVRALNNDGTTYANGSTTNWSFTTTGMPGNFGKINPANAASGQPVNLTLSWSASENATSYELCWRESNGCDEDSPFDPIGNVTSWDLHDLTPGTTYYWNVRALGKDGTIYADGPTTIWSFTTGNLTTTTLASSSNPSDLGQTINFTATILPSAATGTVTFKDGGANIAGCVNASVISGQAACTTSGLPFGAHTITGLYSGDSNYSASTGTLSPDQQVNCGSAITVSNNTDNNPGSLRQAIADLCVGGTITFDDDYSIPLLSELAISKGMTIDGAGHRITVNGNHVTRIFNVSAGQVTFDSLTITGGNVQTTDCGSSTSLCGAGIMLQNGSAIVTVKNSTFSDNSANFGGAIYNEGTLIVANSTFFGNSANYGGGLVNAGTMTITNSTVSGNSANNNGGGINSIGTLNLYNTILANSFGGGDCYKTGGIISGDHNLIESDGLSGGHTCGTTSPINSDPLLAASVADNSGDTQTFALLRGSPAINAGNDTLCAAAVGSPGYGAGGKDQRGWKRPIGLHCDIGAYEFPVQIFMPLIFR